MAASGSKNFSVTRTEIITAALRKCGVFDSGESPSADEDTEAALALNLMVKEWAARGIDLPWREEVTLFLQPNTASYTLGPSGSHATASYVETTLSAAAASSAVTLSLTSTTGMTNADAIGIKLDSGSIHWTTISDVTGVTIASGLASAAASGNKVYVYTTKADRPQKILYAFRRDHNSIDTPVDLIGEVAYRGLSLKSADGPVNQAYYSPLLTNGKLYVWPDNGSATNVDKLVLIAQTLVDDFDAGADNPQFPIEWANALVWNLAAELAPEYGLPLKERISLELKAREKLDTLFDYDVENASVIFGRER